MKIKRRQIEHIVTEFSISCSDRTEILAAIMVDSALDSASATGDQGLIDAYQAIVTRV